MMTEGQRAALHDLLDRMIDEGLEHGISEYIKVPEWAKIITPNPHVPSRPFERTRMELTLKIKNENNAI